MATILIFSENKVNRLANLVEFKRRPVLRPMFCLENLGAWASYSRPFVYTPLGFSQLKSCLNDHCSDI